MGGGSEGWRKRGREGVRGERETLHMKIPLSGDTISRFFEILKTVVDYLRRQSDKSVMTSVSRSLCDIIYCNMQQCVVYFELAILKCMHIHLTGMLCFY